MVIEAYVFLVASPALLALCLKIRAEIAKLSDVDLSNFLSNSVIKVGLVGGFGQLLFLAFSSVECESEARYVWVKRRFLSKGSRLRARSNFNVASLRSIFECRPRYSLKGLSWTECRRGLYAQEGLSGLVALFVIIKLVAGSAPKRYVDRHIIKLRKVATLVSLQQRRGGVVLSRKYDYGYGDTACDRCLEDASHSQRDQA